MTCEDCELLRVELEVAGVFVICLGLAAALFFVALKVKDWCERRRSGPSSPGDV